MKKKAHGKKFVERRKKWFLKRVGEDEKLRKAKEMIDESYDEVERDLAYALGADLITESYPFCYDKMPDDLDEVLSEKYGLETIDLWIFVDIFKEVGIIDERDET